MPESNGVDDSETAASSSSPFLLQACLSRFDALIEEGEICFDGGTTTIVPVGNTFNVSFRLCPTLLSKPVIVSSPSSGTFPDPLATKARNPFEDPDPRYVVSCPVLDHPQATHRLLVNKFPVYRPQLLVTTIALKSQADDLELEDIRAGLDVLRELERAPASDAVKGHSPSFMGIYNCGAHSGNSQPHKHLQIFPKPFANEITLFPEREDSIASCRTVPSASTKSGLEAVYSDPEVPFAHFFAWVDSTAEDTPVARAAAMLATYYILLEHTKRALSLAGVEGRPSYNVVFTRQWILLIPRRAACGEGTGGFSQGPQVNAAGMAGLVWMSNQREFEEWKRRGVAAHLGQCGLRWDEVGGTMMDL